MNSMDASKCQTYDQLNIKLDEISYHLELNEADGKLVSKIAEFLDNNQDLFKNEKSAAIPLSKIAVELSQVSKSNLLVEKIKGYVNRLLSPEKQQANQSLAFLRTEHDYFPSLRDWINLTKVPLANLDLTADELAWVLLNVEHIDLTDFDFNQYDLDELTYNLSEEKFKFVSSDIGSLIKLAKVCAKQNPRVTAQYIQNFKIKDEDILIKIAWLSIKQNSYKTSEYIQNFKIKNRDVLIEMASYCAQENGVATAKYIKNFGIKDPQALIDIAKLCATKNVEATANYIENFGIESPDVLTEIAMFCARQDGRHTPQYIQNFKIQNQDVLIEIAKICAQESGRATASYIQNFKIKDKDVLIEIAKLCAIQDGGGTAYFIQSFKIESKDDLIEIAKLCAVQDGGGTAEYIQNFEIQDKLALIEIAKLCAKQNGYGTAQNVENFEIKNKDVLIEIAKLCAKQNGYGTAFNIQNFEIKDEKVNNQLFLECIFENTFAVFLMRHFNPLPPELEKIANFIYTSKFEENESDLTLLFNEINNLIENPNISEVNQKKILEVKAGIDKLSDYAKNKAIQWFLVSMLSMVSAEMQANDWMLNNQMWQKVFKLRDPSLRMLLTKGVFELSQNKELRTSWDSLLVNGKKKGGGLNLMSLIVIPFRELQIQGVDHHKLEEVFKKLKKRHINRQSKFHMAGHVKTILQTICLLSSSDLFTHEQKRVAFDKIFDQFNQRKDFNSESDSELLKNVWSAKGLIQFKDSKWINSDHHLSFCFFNAFKELIPLKEFESTVSEKYEEFFGSSRNPMGLISYAAGLKTLNDPKAIDALSCFVVAVFNGTFKDARYETKNNPHLAKVFENRLNLMEKWKANKQVPFSETKDKYKVVITDDPIDLLYCGSDVADSCQKVDGNPQLNKGLLGYLLDGKNKLLAIKDERGKIVARSILRILLDGDQPVLYRDRLYPSTLPADQEEALNQLAKDFAEELGLALTSHDGTTPYENTLYSHGGPSPYEYSDANAGVQLGGIYTINEAKLL